MIDTLPPEGLIVRAMRIPPTDTAGTLIRVSHTVIGTRQLPYDYAADDPYAAAIEQVFGNVTIQRLSDDNRQPLSRRYTVNHTTPENGR